MDWQVESIVHRLRKRAEIRRSIPRGEPDRISDLLEEAAKAIMNAEARNETLERCLTICRDIKAPEHYSQAEKHAWDMATTEYWKAIRALMDPVERRSNRNQKD